LQIGCLGYEDKTLSISDFIKTNFVYLTPVSYKLPQIFIMPTGKAKIRNMEIGYLKGKSDYRIRGNIEMKYSIHAIHIIDNKIENAFVKELIYTFDPKYQDGEAIIKVHLYEKDKNADKLMPGKELLPENLIVTVKSKTKILKVNIQKYLIKMPPDGVFVGVEWIKGKIPEKEKFSHSVGGASPVYNGVVIKNPTPTFTKFMSNDWRSQVCTNRNRECYVPMFGLTLMYEEGK